VSAEKGAGKWGKYRGVVVNNIDPEQKGRLLVQVADAQGISPSAWAMPSVPVAGIQSGLFVLPTVGAGVWIEFERGDINKPIWSGGWWGSAAEVPALALAGIPASPNVVLQTPGQTTLVLSDVPAVGITLKTKLGAMIVINDAGILLSNGKGATIMLAGNAVTVNAGALVVT
jgi:Type VI secretion system/phage-baseplate injector OB domain